jgi:hypothetical protein
MKCFIWQQFSSNHSTYFLVVGEFESVETAEAAAHTLQALLNRVEEQGHTPQALHTSTTSPLEQAFFAQYQFDYSPDEQISRWERLVFVSQGEASQIHTPYSQALQMLGCVSCGVEYRGDGNGGFISVWFTATAPDEATASQIADAVHAYISAFQAAADRMEDPYSARIQQMRPWGDDYHGDLIMGDASSTVLRDGCQLRLELVFAETKGSIQAVKAYLEGCGCSDVAYALRPGEEPEVF